MIFRMTIKRPCNLDEEVLVSEFADGAFAELDPFTSMIWPYDVEEFNKSTQGEFSGVGIQIQLDDDGSLKVVSPLEDSPAYRAGIKAGDIITRINGKSAHGITINQAVKTITGVEGTTVTLTIRSTTKDGPVEKDYPIKREKINVASVKGWQHLPGGGVGIFRRSGSEDRLSAHHQFHQEHRRRAQSRGRRDEGQGCQGDHHRSSLQPRRPAHRGDRCRGQVPFRRHDRQHQDRSEPRLDPASAAGGASDAAMIAICPWSCW